MRTSVEISYYPLYDEFLNPIRDFINRINKYPNLVVQTNGMSTQIFGKYSDIMTALSHEIQESFELPHSVFIIKIVNADLQKNT